jgi:hypothetical protein
VNIVYNLTGPGKVQISAYSEAGEKVMTFNDSKPAGLQTSNLFLCCLPPGVFLYIVQIQYDSGGQENLKPGKFVVVR